MKAHAVTSLLVDQQKAKHVSTHVHRRWCCRTGHTTYQASPVTNSNSRCRTNLAVAAGVMTILAAHMSKLKQHDAVTTGTHCRLPYYAPGFLLFQICKRKNFSNTVKQVGIMQVYIPHEECNNAPHPAQSPAQPACVH